MGEAAPGEGLRTTAFTALAGGIVAFVVAQSIAHLALALGAHRVGTILDLDRDNGLPDIVSTCSLAAAAAGAAMVSHREHGARRRAAQVLGGVLGVLGIADLAHDGAHPATIQGKIVIGLVCLAAALLVVVGRTATRRVQATLVVGGCLLAGAFVVTGLDRFDTWFQRERGEPLAEYEIVAKEAFELLGWSLVALALWDAAARVVERFPPTVETRQGPAIAGSVASTDSRRATH